MQVKVKAKNFAAIVSNIDGSWEIALRPGECRVFVYSGGEWHSTRCLYWDDLIGPKKAKP